MPDKPHFTAAQMITALQHTHGLIALAAEHLGCDWHTIYNYVKRYPSVEAELHRQRERTTDLAEQKLFDAIAAGEAWAINFYLKTQGKDRGYVERHEVTGKDGASLHIHLSWDDDRDEAEDGYDSPAATPSRPALRAAQSGPL